MDNLLVDVCVVGAGPAGLALGLELARHGLDVVVVEQSSHFNRSFRGESVSPDGVLLLDRLGVLETIMATGALATRRMEISEGGRPVLRANFDEFPYQFRYPMEIPQPTLLAALEREADKNANFTFVRNTSAVGLLESGDVVRGVRVRGPDGDQEITARLTVGADGRYSKVLSMSGLPHHRIPLERDVVWMKVPLPLAWGTDTYRIRITGDRHGLFIPTYPDLVRVGFNIRKGGLKDLRRQGIAQLYARLDELAPELTDEVRTAVRSWSDTSLLDIFTTTVPRWSRPGLVLIGDAAHTLSPILGQGVNHALVDAMTLAPLIADSLDKGNTGLTAACEEFQQIREPDVRRSRALQLRQEKMFTFASAPAVLLRTMLYRTVDNSSWLKHRILGDVYFPLQSQRRKPHVALTEKTAP